jgi:hypothetical protein
VVEDGNDRPGWILRRTYFYGTGSDRDNPRQDILHAERRQRSISLTGKDDQDPVDRSADSRNKTTRNKTTRDKTTRNETTSDQATSDQTTSYETPEHTGNGDNASSDYHFNNDNHNNPEV